MVEQIPAATPAVDPVEHAGSDRMDREPALTVGTVQALIAAVIAAAVVFGAPIDAEQKAAVLGLVAAAWPIWTAYRIRGKVYAPKTVRQLQVRAAAKADAAGFHRGQVAERVVQADKRRLSD